MQTLMCSYQYYCAIADGLTSATQAAFRRATTYAFRQAMERLGPDPCMTRSAGQVKVSHLLSGDIRFRLAIMMHDKPYSSFKRAGAAMEAMEALAVKAPNKP